MVEKILSKAMMLPLIGTSLYAVGYLLSCWKKRRMTQAVDSTARDAVITEEVRLEAAFRGGPAARFARASQIGHYTDIPFTFALKELNDPVCTIGGSNVPDISHTLEGYRYFCGDTQSYLLDCVEPHAERKEETAQIIDDFLSEAVL